MKSSQSRECSDFLEHTFQTPASILINSLLIRSIIPSFNIHGQKESGLELFRSRMHFGEIKQPKTLLISRNEQLYILKEVENQYVCHDLSV